MLKVRIMPTLLFKDHGLVKGVKFDSRRRIGSVMQAVKVYNMREVDELVFLDINATRQKRSPDFGIIDDIADECFMPLTVGGGVRSIDDIRRLLLIGADKVSINTASVQDPSLIQKAANAFGSQCVVVAIDVKKLPNGNYEAFTHSGTQSTGKDPVALAREVETLGAGEILLTSIDKDGTMTGYDIEITRLVTNAVSIPVIASGGAGNFQHMASILSDGKASAVAASSIFHFTHQTPLEAKQYLRACGIPVRL